MDIVQLISVAGVGGIVGSLLTTIVQGILSHRAYIASRNFQEKKEAYVGLLNAYHKAAVCNTGEAGKEFALWQIRCELVAPEEVRKTIQEIVDTNDNLLERIAAEEKLKTALRKDLRVEINR